MHSRCSENYKSQVVYFVCIWMHRFVLAPCADLQVVSITKPCKAVILLYTWSVTRPFCPPPVLPKRVEFYPGTTLSISLLVHLSACPGGLDVWRLQYILFLYGTGFNILFYVSRESKGPDVHVHDLNATAGTLTI